MANRLKINVNLSRQSELLTSVGYKNIPLDTLA